MESWGHLLRFGFDRELMTTEQSSRYPGPEGQTYTAITVTPGQEISDTLRRVCCRRASPGHRRAQAPAGSFFFFFQRLLYRGQLERHAQPAAEPRLCAGTALTISIATGESFIKIDDMVAPRGGYSWDMKGDGSTKVYGNLGRYYLPVTSNINVTIHR